MSKTRPVRLGYTLTDSLAAPGQAVSVSTDTEKQIGGPRLSSQESIREGTTHEAARLKSEAQQKRERFQLKLRRLLTRMEYEVYGFDRRDKDYAYMLNFLTLQDIRSKLRPTLNDTNWKLLLDNKWFFHLHYSRLGIPLPETYGVYQPRGGTTMAGKPLGTYEELRLLFADLQPENLVIKPVGGIMGRGLLILNEIRYEGGVITAVTNTGHVLSFDDIAKKLDTIPNVRYRTANYELNLPGYILQAKLQQHDVLNAIAPYTTHTMRLITFLDCNNKVHVHFAVLRIGRRGNAADNWDKGGISVALDRNTGVLGRGVIKPKFGGGWVETHPDSGVAFTGLQMPFWDEVKEMCSRAAQATPSLRTVGWDVALTPSGPVLIEGNPDWDLPMVQVHTRGLLNPEVREQLAQFGLTFPQEKLPSISAHEWRLLYEERHTSRKYRNQTFPRRFARLFDPRRIYRKLVTIYNKLGLATR